MRRSQSLSEWIEQAPTHKFRFRLGKITIAIQIINPDANLKAFRKNDPFPEKPLEFESP